jgi:hypothetical protein
VEAASGEWGWRHRAVLNGLGATATFVVAIVVMAAKFTEGAYIVVITVPVLVLLFHSIHRHYQRVASFLEPASPTELAFLRRTSGSAGPTVTAVLFVAQVNELTVRSLYLLENLQPDETQVVTIRGEESGFRKLQDRWSKLGVDIALTPVDSPYREFVRPAVDYVRSLQPGPEHMVIVLIPEFVVEHWWQAVLHNQNALRLKAALLAVPWTVVISIPFHLGAGPPADVQPDGEGITAV